MENINDMERNENDLKNRKKTKKRLSRSAIVLIAGIIIIAIPVLIFAGILGIAALQTGTPREGSRFDGDLDPAIKEDDLTSLKNDLQSIGSVEQVEVILSEGQLKIFVDVQDNLNEEQVDAIVASAYGKVDSRLPVRTYFTATDAKKMYDLQINVYTTAEASDIGAENGRQYKLLHKNSMEENYVIDDMAHPKDPALAAQLEGIDLNQETTEEPEEEDEE